jgi:sialate O-acetylesterase
MAVIIDIGDAKDIHPRNKQDVGKRLALWAQSQVYQKDIVYSGPIYDSLKIEEGKARSRSSMSAAGSRPRAKSSPASRSRARIGRSTGRGQHRRQDGSRVERQGAKPVAVRYAWADNPECNLYNKEGIPASPFRTDDWPASSRPENLDRRPPGTSRGPAVSFFEE